MKAVPVLRCRYLKRSVLFYTEVLDFKWKSPDDEEVERANGIASLTMEGADLQLSVHANDGAFGSMTRVFVADVDERYSTFCARGLDTTLRPESPIHTAPVDQTWGLREFSVTDPDGHSICFCAPGRKGHC